MRIQAGDEVAILNDLSDPPSRVREIAAVRDANRATIRLADGRLFAYLGGVALNSRGYIVPARFEHRVALQKRRSIA